MPKKVVPASAKQSGNTKQIAPSKRWCFTLNNPTPEEYKSIRENFTSSSKTKYIIGKEKGEEGTPHLQGYVHFEKKIRPLSLKLSKRIHWEKAKGSETQNIDYCSKDGSYIGNLEPELPLELLEREQLYVWQEKIVQLVETKPDHRTIHWFWEPEGNTGKTELVRYLIFHHKAVIVNGKGHDILYVAAENKSMCYIFNFTRSKEQYISYEAMEQLKDGVYMSGKYEGKMILRNRPHIICFANFKPAEEKLSKDRWKIKKIKNEKTIV